MVIIGFSLFDISFNYSYHYQKNIIMENTMYERVTEPMPEKNYNEYIPKKQEILREYEIGIRFLSIGCVIRVGCKEIPFTDVNEAMKELSNYVSNPYEEGEKWQEMFKEQG